jgi:hypothetical protein
MGLLARILRPGTPTPPRSTPQASIGAYTGIELPQDPRAILTAQLLPAMTGPPGLRLSESTNRQGRYFGTDIVPPQRFPLSGPPHANQPEELEAAAFKNN